MSSSQAHKTERALNEKLKQLRYRLSHKDRTTWFADINNHLKRKRDEKKDEASAAKKPRITEEKSMQTDLEQGTDKPHKTVSFQLANNYSTKERRDSPTPTAHPFSKTQLELRILPSPEEGMEVYYTYEYPPWDKDSDDPEEWDPYFEMYDDTTYDNI